MKSPGKASTQVGLLSVSSLGLLLLAAPIFAQESPGHARPPDNSHYAFGSYLGSGIYRASEQDATVISLPLDFTLEQSEDSEFLLRLPISVGFFNYSLEDAGEFELPSSVGTLTVTPGFEKRWRLDENWRMEAYGDLGFGSNFDQGGNVAIMAAGISGLRHFELWQADSLWVTRLKFAAYSERAFSISQSFSVLQTGVDIGLPYHWSWQGLQMQPRVFALGYWYFDQLQFAGDLNQDTLVSGSVELGATLALAKPVLGIDRLGISYRSGDGLEIWRLVFSMPI